MKTELKAIHPADLGDTDVCDLCVVGMTRCTPVQIKVCDDADVYNYPLCHYFAEVEETETERE